MDKIKIIVCGAAGKMGTLITELALQKKDEFTVIAGIEEKGHPSAGKKNISGVFVTGSAEDVISGDEIVIDFSVPTAALKCLQVCLNKRAPFVTGTTGFTSEDLKVIEDASTKIPVFCSPNMSYGVNLFFEIVKNAAQLLKEYETEISEIHHRFKKDAPSGTAKKIAEILCSVSGRNPERAIKYGREGIVGPRSFEEIGMHSLRMGDVVGEHYVHFAGKGEIIEISHRCYNRESFALGALKAAQFIKDRPAGIYLMSDLIEEDKKKMV